MTALLCSWSISFLLLLLCTQHSLNYVQSLGMATEKDKDDFLTELNIMKKLEPHPNVVQFFGCSTGSGKI